MIICACVYSYIFQHHYSHTAYRDAKSSGAHTEMRGCACLVCTGPVQFKTRWLKPTLVSSVKETQPVVLLIKSSSWISNWEKREGGILLFVNKLQLHGQKHAVALPALMFHHRKQGWTFITIGPFILVQSK